MTLESTPPATLRPDPPDWVRDAVFYQVFPDRFAASDRVPKPGPLEPWDAPPTNHGFKGGDLLGVAEHLDELVELGITALYLNPVFSSASNHRYHTVDYYAVDPLLGGEAALRELLDAAHARGMRVVLDGVFNHASRGFWPFDHVIENGAQSPYREWFYLSPDVLAGRRGVIAYPGPSEMAAIATAQAGGAWDGAASERVLGYRGWWDLPALPKLKQSNPAVREHIFGAVEHWLRFGADGWRLDVPQEIGEPGFWEEFRRRVRAVNPEAYLVGEIWSPAPEWLAGDRFDATMNYPLAETILSFVAARTLDRDVLAQTHDYRDTVRPIGGTAFLRDLERVMTLYPPEVTSVQLNLLDSHDTPRFLSLAGGDKSALRLAWLVTFTLPGAPCIYYGDEVGLAGRHDPDCRRAFPWDLAAQDRELRGFLAGLAALRHAEPALRRGRFRALGAGESAAAYAMTGASETFVVALNGADSTARLEVDVPELSGRTVEKVSWQGCGWPDSFAPGVARGGMLELEIGPRQGLVVRGRTAA